SSLALLQQIIDSLHNEFDITDLGALNYFLGISADLDTDSKLGPKGVPIQDPALYCGLAGGLRLPIHTQVRVLHVPSCYQYADIFTKGLPLALFEDF
ncbi:ribonuclease H-like domain-containing protein, partial [Tanacetum coccineum]